MDDVRAAIRSGDYFRVRDLLDAGFDPKAADQYGMTTLHSAALNGRAVIAQLLIERGANPDAVDWDGDTPLHYATDQRNSSPLRSLLDAGANPNIANAEGWTPLHIAANHGDEYAVRLLLDAGANPTLTDRDGMTAAQLTSDPEPRAMLDDAAYVWDHPWTIEEHSRWPEARRLEYVALLSALRDQPSRQIELPKLPREIEYSVFGR